MLLLAAACASSSRSTAPSADAVFYGGAIQVVGPAGQSTLTLAKIEEIKQVAGVRTAFPTYRFDVQTGQVEAGGLVSTDSIIGSDPTEAAWSSVKTQYAQGHAIDADSSGEVVLGAQIAKELNKKIDDTIGLPVKPAGAANHSFKVVGILAVTSTAPDRTAYVNVTDGQMLLRDGLGPAQPGGEVDVASVATAIDVYAKPGSTIAELDRIADQINNQVTGVKAIRPSQLVAGLKS